MNIIYGENVEVPPLLYKYRDWNNNNHKKILTERELYFAKPSSFGAIDLTRECQLLTDYEVVTKKSLYMHFLNICERDHPNWAISKKEEYANYWSINSPLNDINHSMQCDRNFFNDLDPTLGVLSLSPLWNNTNLWNEFGCSGKGFTVGFDGELLFNDKERFGSGGKVKYYDFENPPKISPFLLTSVDRISAMLKVIYSLPSSFESEKEYRITKMNIKKRNVQVPLKAIKEVVFGNNIPLGHKTEILDIVKVRMPHVKTYKIVKDLKGRLSRMLIE